VREASVANTLRAGPSSSHDAAPATRVLVGEDEDNVAFVAGTALRLAGFDVYQTALGIEALEVAGTDAVELIVLDVALRDLDGFEICRRLRAAGNAVPIVFLTARDEPRDRLRGLTIGGDDCLTKPFSVEELVATVRAALRRAGKATTSHEYRCGHVALDDDAHRVTSGGRTVNLSPTEYKLLRFLLYNAGRVLTRRQILDQVWDYDFDGEMTLIETYVSGLRKKLEDGKPLLIQTVRGIGYRMAEP
jgi:two-component system, OmpR family, response regulator